MNKLIIALCASAFAFGSVSALADSGGNDVMPLSKLDTQQAKAAREAAQAKWAKMTPQEQAAAKKAARSKKLSEATAMDATANESGSMSFDTKQGKADAAASKAMPVPTKEQRQKDLTTLEKKAGPGN